jgi:hypothetical protein
VDRTGTIPDLRLLGMCATWHSPVLEAECPSGTFTTAVRVDPAGRTVTYTDREVPHWDPNGRHICGIHAWIDPVQALSYGGLGFARECGIVVLGRVDLSGKIIEHEDGYRAAAARLTKALILYDSQRIDPWLTPQRTERSLRHRYGPLFELIDLRATWLRMSAAESLDEIARRISDGADR